MCCIPAGAAGLATALRGTVREAVDAYQHTQQHSSSGQAAAVPSGTLQQSVAGSGAGSIGSSRAAAAGTAPTLSQQAAAAVGTAGSRVGQNGAPAGSGYRATALSSLGLSARGPVSILQSGSRELGSVSPSAAAAGALDIAADITSGVATDAGAVSRSGSGARLGSGSGRMLSSSRGQSSNSSWDDFDTGEETSAAVSSSVHRQLR